MVFTHVLVGVLVGAAAAVASGGPVGTLVLAGAVGGALPDGDMVFVHRKTLHYPVAYSALAVVTGVGAVAVSLPIVVVLAVAFAAAAVHCLMDLLGGGKEMRPWLERDDRAAYDHVRQRWLRPRRVFYDGSKTDFAVAVVAAALAWWVLPSRFDGVLAGLVGASAVYVLVRRRITEWISEDHETFSGFIQEKL
ncbi:metal-dependent hydrolase [Halorubellus sp. JP-L1]|uniref:metal-dependent hydrolase n=1 Tax=Halorubellus sp. JP-L1 TaxID=2715753 RepID=UPI001407AC16|nr:metal-dependent hydrolase [Halorubellus sp. JP-L1]NHN40971.1 metal-dependent hydrolase [Halorubellus sp. JP-L1]